MDWDGIGTFALFLSTGAVGVGFILLKAYKLRIEARLEQARLQRGGEASSEVHEQVERLEREVGRLAERLDFTERLLGEGVAGAPDESDPP